MIENRRILKAAGGMSLVTSLSRILGYGRDALNAALFGAGAISDAFFVAYRIPNMLRELFAEGALSAAFIPSLARAREEAGPGAVWHLAAMMLNAVILVMSLVVLTGIGLAEPLVALLAPGFRNNPEQFDLAVMLTRVMFPFIGFMSVGALLMGMLNAHQKFVLPAFAPVAMNLVMIASGLWLCPLFGLEPRQQVVGWALGAVLGGLSQALVQAPAAWKEGLRAKLAWPFTDPGVRKVLKQMVPAVMGLSVVQVNILVNQNLASTLESGSISFLYYGNRLMQLPLGVFGVAVATAVLPTLSKHSARRQPQHFKDTLGFGLRLTLLLTLPAAAGIWMLAGPINELLFMWVRFTAQDAALAAQATGAYCVGILFAAMVKILAPAFYALEDSRTPVKIAVVMVALNLALALSLMGPLRFSGLALAVSLTAAANAGLLLWMMGRKLRSLGAGGGFGLGLDTLRCVAAVALMVVALAGAARLLGPLRELELQSRLVLAASVFGRIFLGAGVYFILLRLLGVDLKALWKERRAVDE